MAVHRRDCRETEDSRSALEGENMKVVCILEREEEKDERFFEILYDERLTEGPVCIPRTIFTEAGGWNYRIKAKRQYELLLRLAKRYPLAITECGAEENIPKDYMLLKEPKVDLPSEEIRTDSYIISRYSDMLLSHQRLNEVVESYLLAAESRGLKEEAADLLEKMLRRGKEYYDIDDAVRPVLIYKGVDICYNILNRFAEQFGEALQRMGAQVEYFDPEKEDLQEMAGRIGRHYRAVIGWQSYMFSITAGKEERYLHERICAPAFNFIFDHPIWEKPILENSPRTVSVLTLDAYYVAFCKKYYQKHAYLFPPAGVLPQTVGDPKCYDISFIGTYENIWADVAKMHQMDRNTRFLANRFLLALRKNPNQTADETFRQVLEERRGAYTDEEYLEAFFRCRRMIFIAMHYNRGKVIETLLKAGCTVDVFGESWANCPLKKYPNLIRHPGLTGEACMEVWQQSRISLNIMSWHRGGFTERMANIMLCKTVLATEDTEYLRGKFEHGRDLLIFHMDAIEQLPAMMKAYLNNPKELNAIADSGYEKAKKDHTWDRRAEVFLKEILEEEACSRK